MKIKKIFFVLLILPMLHIMGQDKPNVLFIAIDDLNDYINCMDGAISVPTPNIDRLAQQGTLFTNAHCQAPICGPSRASIMTGLYPSTTGNYLQLNDANIKKSNDAVSNATFMPDYFEKYGYKTMAVGKIFHGGDGVKSFDEYGGRFEWFGPKPKKKMGYDLSKLPNKIGKTYTDWGPYPAQDSLMTDYKSAKWAVNKLDQEYDQPFFLAVGFVRPHVPWHAPQKWFDMFPLDSIETPPYKKDDYDDISPFAQKVMEAPMMPTTEELIKLGEWKKAVQAYMACIAFVDAQVGKVLDALENSKHADDTVIVLWSDHGYHLGEKNRFAKMSLWERDTRTVLIIKDLEERQTQKCDAPVQLIDIYPTLLDICNLPTSEKLEGHSLKSLIENPNKKWKYPALSFYGEGNIAVRDDQYRLIKYEDGSLELYDMQKDPNEWHNLAKDKKYRNIIKKLRRSEPNTWAPLSEYTSYNFNDYFKSKTKAARNK